MKVKKQFGILILILLLALTVGGCSRASNGLIGTWKHYATVWDDVPHETLGLFRTFYADGTGRIWHPETEKHNTFEWESVKDKLFVTDSDAIIRQIQDSENPMPDDLLQLMLDQLKHTFFYEIDGDKLILTPTHISHQNVYEIFIRIDYPD